MVNFIEGLLLGIMIGGTLGIVLMAILVAGKMADIRQRGE